MADLNSRVKVNVWIMWRGCSGRSSLLFYLYISYTERRNLPWHRASTFMLAGSIAIVIAFVAVSIQSIAAAMTNPVQSLRSE